MVRRSKSDAENRLERDLYFGAGAGDPASCFGQALTAVVAPMGYGKTTAVNWFLNQRRQTEAAVILRVNIYSDNRFIFWKSVQNAFAAAGAVR